MPGVSVESRLPPIPQASNIATPAALMPARPGLSQSTSQPPPVAQTPNEAGPSRPPGNASEPPPSGPNQFVDTELLKGVSLGFDPPVLSTSMKPFPGVIPNVIALPYGRCPPFHLKAPTWRDLMKLLARLSGTRLEPTIEAMSAVKTEMRVRVVVNFVKVHQSSAAWHVAVYMTIDYPIPKDLPQAVHNRAKESTTLPFSYTLSPLPGFLRESADAPLSKWFTIPPTEANPHPKLPISFPDLARYLMDTLDESRHDSSSSMRRLSKLVDTYYPTEPNTNSENPEQQGGIFSFFKRRRPSRDRNADTFDVVTPFVADEWGG